MIMSLFGGSSEDTVGKYRSSAGELGVYTLALEGIEDPFDPDPMWDRRYGGGGKVVERITGDRDFRLQAALDGCRNSKFERDEAGRFREANPVFTDIVMWIPEAAWKADAIRGGHHMEVVARNLAHLHRGKFRGSLDGDRTPIYTVMPDPELAENVVVFQFGFGVYVPGGDEVLRAEISLRRKEKDEPQTLPEWSFWRSGAQIKRPAGVYEGQESLLITPDNSGPIRTPVWFGEAGGHLLINLNAADSERIYAGDQRVRTVRSNIPESPTEPADWFLQAADSDDTLIVRIRPLGDPVRLRETRAEQAVPEDARTRKLPGKPKLPKKPKKEKPAAEKTPARSEPVVGAPGATAPTEVRPAPAPARARSARDGDSLGQRLGIDRILGGLGRGGGKEETPLSTRFALKLNGLGLMRVDGRRAIPGIRGWTIWFDDDGQPLQFGSGTDTDTERALAVMANAEDNRMFYRLAGEREFSPAVHLPSVLPTVHGQHLELHPSPLPDRYHAILRLAGETAFPLSPRTLVLGRSNITPDSPQPDLPLEILTHPRSLQWYDGAGYHGAKLNAINLSRRHVDLRLNENRLDLSMADGTSPVFVLDRDGSLMHTLEPKSRKSVALEPGQMILVGCYLLRFHEERARTMESAAHSMVHRG